MKYCNSKTLYYDKIPVGKVILMTVTEDNFNELEYLFANKYNSKDVELRECRYEHMLSAIFNSKIKSRINKHGFSILPITVLAIWMEEYAPEIVDYSKIYKYFDTYYLNTDTDIIKVYDKFKKKWKKVHGKIKDK